MASLGAIELGGTKIRVARGDAGDAITDSETFPTTGPDESFERVRAFFRSGPPVAAIGLGSFGPVVVGPDGPDRGLMLATPKPGWSGFNVVRALEPLQAPVRIQTDVAAAGLGEFRHGALKDVPCGVYLTVGTGIGGALLIDGRVVNGAAHAEMGHIRLHRAAEDRAPSVCPYHSDCAEGLASGPAIERRFGHSLSAPDATDRQRALIGDYLGQLTAALVLTLSPHRVVIGGGVAKTPGLLEDAQRSLTHHLNGYAIYREMGEPGFLAPPMLKDDAGLVGALLLAGNPP